MKYKPEDFTIKGTKEAFDAFINASIDSVCRLDEFVLQKVVEKAYQSCRPHRDLKCEFVLHTVEIALCEHFEDMQAAWSEIAPVDRIQVFQAMLQGSALRNFFGNAIDRSVQDNAGQLYRKLGATIENGSNQNSKLVFKDISARLKTRRSIENER